MIVPSFYTPCVCSKCIYTYHILIYHLFPSFPYSRLIHLVIQHIGRVQNSLEKTTLITPYGIYQRVYASICVIHISLQIRSKARQQPCLSLSISNLQSQRPDPLLPYKPHTPPPVTNVALWNSYTSFTLRELSYFWKPVTS